MAEHSHIEWTDATWNPIFHESVPDAWIDRVFAVMALAPQHTFQVLTKRAARMREYVSRSARFNTWIEGYIREHNAMPASRARPGP